MLSLLFFLMCFSGAIQSSAAKNVVATAREASGGEWKNDAGGRRYYSGSNGQYVKNAWRKIDGYVYRFNAQGYVRTGWITYKGNKYYADSDGKLCVSSWVKIGQKYYYLLANGTLAKKRMIRSGKKYYYVNKSGVRVTNSWVTLKKKKYYFDWSGVRLQNTWVMDKGQLYYMGASGAMAVKQWVDNNRYYVGANGARKKNCVVDGYYLDANGRKTDRSFKGDYIFVGDSRTVGMKLAVSPKDTKYIAKESMGYSWLESTAGPELESCLNAKQNVSVVLAFGINDLANIQNYIAYYKSLIAQYPKTRFYALSVGPVNEKIEAAHGYSVKNKAIAAFNKAMRSALGKSRYINSYTYLKKKNFETVDGVHYTLSEYKGLYDFIMSKIKR